MEVRPWALAYVAAGLLATAAPARADATLFAGALSAGGGRSVVGGSIGLFARETRSVIGFEIDYTRTLGGARTTSPRISTFGGSLLVQVPIVDRRMNAYAAFGGTLYQEATPDDKSAGGAFNVGGGVKVTLAGPLKLRLDYRFFRVRFVEASTGSTHPQRVTIGLALAF